MTSEQMNIVINELEQAKQQIISDVDDLIEFMKKEGIYRMNSSYPNTEKLKASAKIAFYKCLSKGCEKAANIEQIKALLP